MTWHLFVSIAFLICAYPLYSMARGKVEDWISFAEFAVRYELRGNAEGRVDLLMRSAMCAVRVPRLLRSRLMRRARARVSA